MLLPALRKSFAGDNAVPAPGLLNVYVNMVFNLDVPINMKDIFDSEFPEDAVYDEFDDVFD